MTLLATSDTLPAARPRAGRREPLNVDWEPGAQNLRLGRLSAPRPSYDAGNVQTLNRQFVDVLTEVGLEVAAQGDELLPLPPASRDRYGAALRAAGEEAYGMLPREVGAFLQRKEQEAGDRGVGVNFTLEDKHAFLWEMVYQGHPDDALDWGEFWGFRFPIGHLFWETETASSVRLRRGMFASTHDDLPLSVEEVRQLGLRFAELRRRFGLDLTLQRLEDALAREALADPAGGGAAGLLKLLATPDFGFGIVHFACHCDGPPPGDPGGVTDAYLRLTAHAQEIEVKARTFLTRQAHGTRFQHGPLVFLNACKSGTPLYLLQSFGLPMNLLKFGAGGVIATACSVPDTFASAFAAEFYARLLDRPLVDDFPTYVGEVLLATRLHFLHAYNNPLGLAYGLYGESDQQLELRP